MKISGTQLVDILKNGPVMNEKGEVWNPNIKVHDSFEGAHVDQVLIEFDDQYEINDGKVQIQDKTYIPLRPLTTPIIEVSGGLVQDVKNLPVDMEYVIDDQD